MVFQPRLTLWLERQAMKLHPCPLCGESKGYTIRHSHESAASAQVICLACWGLVTLSASARAKNVVEAWNAAAAHAQGLRERIKWLEEECERLKECVRTSRADEAHCWSGRIAELENEAREHALQALASEGQWIEQTGAQQKLIAELEAQRVPLTEWQPIETAPRDGSLFLCWVSATRYGETDEGQQYQQDASQIDFCSWREGPPDMPGHGYFDPCCGQIADSQDVTHWMPLPPPPVERAHGIEEGKR